MRGDLPEHRAQVRADALAMMEYAISQPGFFDFLSTLDADAALDKRDAQPFDALWLAAFDAARDITLSQAEKKHIDAIREQAFKRALKISGNTEIAGCVSDDMELILKNLLTDPLNGWPLQVLWDAYRNQRFPC